MRRLFQSPNLPSGHLANFPVIYETLDTVEYQLIDFNSHTLQYSVLMRGIIP